MSERIDREEKLDASFLERFKRLESTGALDDLAELRRENRELEMLVNDAAVLLSKDRLDELVDYALQRILERFAPMRLALLYEPPRGAPIVQFMYRAMQRVSEEVPEAWFRTLVARFENSPHPLDFAQLRDELGEEALSPALRQLEPSLALPLLGFEGIYGVLVLGARLAGGGYSAPERIYVDRLTRFLSVGIQNRLNHETSIRDAKTGLFAHDYFMRRLEEESARVARHHERSGVVMIDVDHFKHFNDTYGHLAGDAVLETLAATVRAQVRGEDVAARFGGEEFCILAVDCGEEGEPGSIYDVAERLRKAIAAMQVDFGGQRLSVTASMGCCYLDPLRGRGPEQTLELADKALYISKTSGRNRSTLYGVGLLARASLRRSVSSEGSERVADR